MEACKQIATTLPKWRHLPRLLATAQASGKTWLVTPAYADPLAGLRAGSRIVQATEQANTMACVVMINELNTKPPLSKFCIVLSLAESCRWRILSGFLAAKGLIHGDVSAYNIAVKDDQAVLIDLPTLRSIDGLVCPCSLQCKQHLP